MDSKLLDEVLALLQRLRAEQHAERSQGGEEMRAYMKAASRQVLREAAVASRDAEADRRRYQELQAQFGPQLDALPRWKQIQLAKDLLSPFLLERLRRDNQAPLARIIEFRARIPPTLVVRRNCPPASLVD